MVSSSVRILGWRRRSGTVSSVIAPPFHRRIRRAYGSGFVAAGGDVHFLQQGAQQLLAVLVGGGGRVPHLAEVVAEGDDRRALGRGEGLRPGGCPGRRRGSAAWRGWRGSGPARPGGGAGPARRRGRARAARQLAGTHPARRPARPGTRRRRRRRWPARRRSCAGHRGRRPGQQDPGSSSSGLSWPGRGRRWPACGRRTRRWPGPAAARCPRGPRRCPAGWPAGGYSSRCGPRSPETLLRSGLKASLWGDAVCDRPVVAGDDWRGVVDFADEQVQGAGDARCAGGSGVTVIAVVA